MHHPLRITTLASTAVRLDARACAATFVIAVTMGWPSSGIAGVTSEDAGLASTVEAPAGPHEAASVTTMAARTMAARPMSWRGTDRQPGADSPPVDARALPAAGQPVAGRRGVSTSIGAAGVMHVRAAAIDAR